MRIVCFCGGGGGGGGGLRGLRGGSGKRAANWYYVYIYKKYLWNWYLTSKTSVCLFFWTE